MNETIAYRSSFGHRHSRGQRRHCRAIDCPFSPRLPDGCARLSSAWSEHVVTRTSPTGTTAVRRARTFGTAPPANDEQPPLAGLISDGYQRGRGVITPVITVRPWRVYRRGSREIFFNHPVHRRTRRTIISPLVRSTQTPRTVRTACTKFPNNSRKTFFRSRYEH